MASGPTTKILTERFGEDWDNPVAQMKKSLPSQPPAAVSPQETAETQRHPSTSSSSSSSSSSSLSSINSDHEPKKAVVSEINEPEIDNRATILVSGNSPKHQKNSENAVHSVAESEDASAYAGALQQPTTSQGNTKSSEIEMSGITESQKVEAEDEVGPFPPKYERREPVGAKAHQRDFQKRRGTEGAVQSGIKGDGSDGEGSDDGDVAIDIPPPAPGAPAYVPPPVIIKPVTWRGMFRFADRSDRILMLFGAIFAVLHGVALPCSLLFYREILNILIVTDIKKAEASKRKEYCDEICRNATIFYNETCIGQDWFGSGGYRSDFGFEILRADINNCSVANTTAEACKRAPFNVSGTFLDGVKCVGDPLNTFDQVVPYALGLIGIGLATMVVAFTHIFFWNIVAERQVCKIRCSLFESILSKHIGWFDVRDARALNSQLYDETSKLQDGLGEKISTTLQMLTTFITGFAISFSVQAELAAVVVALVPVLLFVAGALTRMMRIFGTKQAIAYSKAGSLAVQTLGNIRTVTAFGRQEFEVDKYANNLYDAQKTGIRRSVFTGLGQGIIWFILTSTQVLALWYGLTQFDNFTAGGDVSLVILGIMIGAMQFGQAAPNLEILATARAAAGQIFAIIDEPTKLNNFSQEGKRPKEAVKGSIKVENVKFAYPKDPTFMILKGVSFEVKPGQTIALVGPSGSGKSTIIQILLRFYDAASGRVTLDGEDITQLNVNWLRDQIGFVGQEPVLFSRSIAENIRMGKPGASDQEVEAAARLANAHTFINNLPEKYDTFVGDRGAQLSGGQKQRIAIARGIIKNPRILLLDEATSALDTHSERIVQDALERASAGRTTIVIAHRLSTIKNADTILVLRSGQIVESGTHTELMAKGERGAYYALAKAQQLSEAVPSQVDPEEADEDSADALITRVRMSSQRKRTSTMTSRKDSKMEPRNRQASVISNDSELGNEDIDIDEDDAEAIAKRAPPAIVLRWNAKEWHYILFGSIAAIFAGLVYPFQAVVISRQLANFAIVDPVARAQDVQQNAIAQLILGVILAVSFTLQFAFFGISGEKLTARLRKKSFSAMLRQEVSWFDRPENQPGSLAATLATDTTAVQGSAGSRIGVVLNLAANVGTAFVYGMVLSWEVTLAAFAIIPIFIAAGVFTVRVNMGAARKDSTALKRVAQASTEAIGNMRTVVALGQHPTFLRDFSEVFEEIVGKVKRKAAIQSAAMGVANGMLFFSWALVFGFGSSLIDNGSLDFVMLFRIYNMSTVGGLAASRMAAFVPDLGKARVAAGKIFTLLNLRPTIDWTSKEGTRMVEFFGKVEFRNVRFHYPNRPDVKILRGLTFKAETGQTVALVGASGCGKSTCLQLIERFYSPTAGDILIDDKPIQNINISWLRGKMGLISQEPALFDGTIWENVMYGTVDDEKIAGEVPDGLIRRRTQHSVAFVEDLREGFNTTVGDRGGQMSGGQKQRIAVARALARNPRLLLCDEATSALDNTNEKLVQADIDAAREGRTCLIVAHRLATIQHADKILVFDKGRIAEEGTHDELLAKRGLYYALNMAQNLGGGH